MSLTTAERFRQRIRSEMTQTRHNVTRQGRQEAAARTLVEHPESLATPGALAGELTRARTLTTRYERQSERFADLANDAPTDIESRWLRIMGRDCSTRAAVQHEAVDDLVELRTRWDFYRQDATRDEARTQ